MTRTGTTSRGRAAAASAVVAVVVAALTGCAGRAPAGTATTAAAASTGGTANAAPGALVPGASPATSGSKPVAKPAASTPATRPAKRATTRRAKPGATVPPAVAVPVRPGTLASLHLAPLPDRGGRVYRTVVHTRAGEQFDTGYVNVWIPNGTDHVYGLLVPGVFEGVSQSADVPLSDAWKSTALRYHLGIVGHRYTAKAGVKQRREAYGEYGTGAGMLRGFTQLAAASGHPELATAKLVLDGYSLATALGNGLMKIAPQRIALITEGGSSFLDVHDYPAAARIPILLYGGADDGFLGGSRQALAAGRANGAPWALALQPGRGHDIKRTTPITPDWWLALIPLRLSATPGGPVQPLDLSRGYAGSADGRSVVPYASASASARAGSWIPDARAARDWLGFWRTA